MGGIGFEQRTKKDKGSLQNRDIKEGSEVNKLEGFGVEDLKYLDSKKKLVLLNYLKDKMESEKLAKKEQKKAKKEKKDKKKKDKKEKKKRRRHSSSSEREESHKHKEEKKKEDVKEDRKRVKTEREYSPKRR